MSIEVKLGDMLRKADSLPFLFIGSGLSRRYLGLESWDELIRLFASKAMPGKDFAFELYKNKVDMDNKITGSLLLPIITKYIEKDFTEFFLTSDEYATLRAENKVNIEKGNSALKIAVARHFKDKEYLFQTPELNNEVKKLKKLKKHVSGIITTNYDQFLEYLFDDFKVYIGQDELLFNPSYNIAEVYKIHGCCSFPETLILNQSDYDKFNEKNAYLAAKLLTIFLEHPIIFMGYSINDTNIKTILQAIAKCLTMDQLEILRNRLFFIEWNQKDEDEFSTHSIDFYDDKIIQMIRVKVNDFTQIYNAITKCQSKYSPKVLRKLKEDIYELVLTNDPKGKLTVVDIDDNTNLDNIDFIVGVGIKGEHLGRSGYRSIKAEDLYQDIVFDNRKFNNEWIVEDTLPELSKHTAGSIPIYKYLSIYDKEVPETVFKIKKNEFEDFLSATIKNDKIRNPAIESDIRDIQQKYDLNSLQSITKCLLHITRLDESKINIEQLRELLAQILSTYDNILKDKTYNINTNLKRIIKIYDWLKYYKN